MLPERMVWVLAWSPAALGMRMGRPWLNSAQLPSSSKSCILSRKIHVPVGDWASIQTHPQRWIWFLVFNSHWENAYCMFNLLFLNVSQIIPSYPRNNSLSVKVKGRGEGYSLSSSWCNDACHLMILISTWTKTPPCSPRASSCQHFPFHLITLRSEILQKWPSAKQP